MTAMTPVPADDPLMIAWNDYAASEGYENTKRWATREEHTEGSLWAAFEAGFNSRPAAAPPSLEAPAEIRLTDEQLEAGISQARRIINQSAGYYFGGELTPFAEPFKSLALRAIDRLSSLRSSSLQNTSD